MPEDDTVTEQDATHAPDRDAGADDGAGASPETGDLVVDAALRYLEGVDPDDLDATLDAGEAVHSTLTSRLSDLGT